MNKLLEHFTDVLLSLLVQKGVAKLEKSAGTAANRTQQQPELPECAALRFLLHAT